ncbi:MAG: hypothetical protein WDO15_12435 [Bacteroidota bacterium]
MLAGVSISNNINGKWSKPKALNIENDYNYNEKANYFLTNNRKTLIMSVERDDSRGGRDLYVSFMKDDSVWTEPKNLGDVINTAGERTAPFLASDDQTMYFSSNGFSGYGGSDIYMTKRLDDTYTNWSEPKNMGSRYQLERRRPFLQHSLYQRICLLLTRRRKEHRHLSREASVLQQPQSLYYREGQTC